MQSSCACPAVFERALVPSTMVPRKRRSVSRISPEQEQEEYQQGIKKYQHFYSEYKASDDLEEIVDWIVAKDYQTPEPKSSNSCWGPEIRQCLEEPEAASEEPKEPEGSQSTADDTIAIIEDQPSVDATAAFDDQLTASTTIPDSASEFARSDSPAEAHQPDSTTPLTNRSISTNEDYRTDCNSDLPDSASQLASRSSSPTERVVISFPDGYDSGDEDFDCDAYMENYEEEQEAKKQIEKEKAALLEQMIRVTAEYCTKATEKHEQWNLPYCFDHLTQRGTKMYCNCATENPNVISKYPEEYKPEFMRFVKKNIFSLTILTDAQLVIYHKELLTCSKANQESIMYFEQLEAVKNDGFFVQFIEVEEKKREQIDEMISKVKWEMKARSNEE